MDELKGNHNEITFCNLRFIIAGVATFSTSSLAAQSLRFVMKPHKPIHNILRRKNLMNYAGKNQRRTEIKTVPG